MCVFFCVFVFVCVCVCMCVCVCRQVASSTGVDLKELRARGDRGHALKTMGEAASVHVSQMYASEPFDGIIGCGGTGGTSMVCAVMRALPQRVAKVCVSTAASTDCSRYVGGSNLVMIPSLVDLTGRKLNAISHQQLCMAAGALQGMVQCVATSPKLPHPRPVVLASMFGNTTVRAVRSPSSLRVLFAFLLLYRP
jgi:uncharacterized protein (UPF0261 family)